MKNLKLTVFASCIFLLACTPKTMEKATSSTAPSTISSNEQETDKFPESWVGNWNGTLDIYRGSGKTQSIPMKMSILPSGKKGEYTWLTTYGDKAATSKPYLLKTLDAVNGLYAIDEQNSIVLESYLFDNTLVNWFVVEGSLILASYKMINGQILFEILAGTEKEISTTGDQEVDGEAIPAVRTLPINVMQRATLIKEK